MTERMQTITGLLILGLFLGGVIGCAPQATPPTVLPTPTVPPGWETYSEDPDGKCGFALDHPSDMKADSQGTHSWILNRTTADPGGPVPNFIYISVIPDDFHSTEPGAIYNYDPGETQTLMSMQVGESRSLRDDPNLAPSFTYTRLPDATLADQAAQAYENTQPWEFPPSTKEIRYYVRAQGCTFLVGGYLSTVGTGQPGAIGEDLFGQIVSSFRLP
jgi:hypothetical protein